VKSENQTLTDEEQGWKWWIRFVIVPLIAGGGFIAVVADLNRSPGLEDEPQLPTATSAVQGSLPIKVMPADTTEKHARSSEALVPEGTVKANLENVSERFSRVVTEQLSATTFGPNSDLINDLDAANFEIEEFIFGLEEEFGIKIERMQTYVYETHSLRLRTLGEWYAYVVNRLQD
jgi:acyl carrier protein